TRLLYLHVPKTGGGAIETWLKTLAPLHFHSIGMPNALRCTPQHFRMADFRALFGDGWFDHAAMTVRNPYDRIASEYRMRAVLSGQGFWKAWPQFSLWLETNLEAATKNPFHLDNHLRPQWEFHGSGVEVLRYEDGLLAAAAHMAMLLGVEPPTELPRVHDTSEAQIEVSWDLSDRLRVQEFYRKDFEIFGYPP
ncbi:sulfotransferase family 2 domain-containing protein, partial [Niveispirillum fermenti]|uniref:sulfotransferase family 2 domain-containing protein n=1 Tax=Niveispirillum fermenti TaxID=1233113 RepID=UPI003A8AF638